MHLIDWLYNIFHKGTEVDISYFPPPRFLAPFLRMSCLVAVFGWDMFSRFLQPVQLRSPTYPEWTTWNAGGYATGPMPSGSLCASSATKQTRGVRWELLILFMEIGVLRKQLWFQKAEDESIRMRMIYDDILSQIVLTKWTRTCLLLHVSSRLSSLESVDTILPTVWQFLHVFIGRTHQTHQVYFYPMED